MRKILLTFLSFISLSTFASEESDIIIYNGNQYLINSFLLEKYIKIYSKLIPKSKIATLGNLNNYRATYEIVESELFLKDIEIKEWDYTKKVKNLPIYDSLAKISGVIIKPQYGFNWKSIINSVFLNQSKIKITSFTGLFVIPYGKKEYHDPESIKSYEKYFLFEVNKGDIIKERNFNYAEFEYFKDLQFEELKKTDEYKKVRKEVKKEFKPFIKLDKSVNQSVVIDFLMRQFIVNYTSKILIK